MEEEVVERRWVWRSSGLTSWPNAAPQLSQQGTCFSLAVPQLSVPEGTSFPFFDLRSTDRGRSRLRSCPPSCSYGLSFPFPFLLLRSSAADSSLPQCLFRSSASFLSFSRSSALSCSSVNRFSNPSVLLAGVSPSPSTLDALLRDRVERRGEYGGESHPEEESSETSEGGRAGGLGVLLLERGLAREGTVREVEWEWEEWAEAAEEEGERVEVEKAEVARRGAKAARGGWEGRRRGRGAKRVEGVGVAVREKEEEA